MEDLVRVTVVSREAEPRSEFNKRLIDFWTHVLRTYPDEYELVYAETVEFVATAQALSKQYLISEQVIGLMEEQLRSIGIGFEPIDMDDLYTKYEATPPEWFQIPH